MARFATTSKMSKASKTANFKPSTKASTIKKVNAVILKKWSLLKSNQYYKTVYKKRRFMLHHTSGGTATSSIAWWNQKPDHIATAIMIPRNGQIWELFNPKYWAYALGKTNWGSKLEKECIQIEVANWGGLTKVGSKYYSWSGKLVPSSKVITYKSKHRGYKHFERYTDKQVEAIVATLAHYAKKFNIVINPKKLEKFWWGKKSIVGMAVLAHTSVRGDKSDIHPQPNLIKAIYDHFGCTAKVTE